MVELSLLWSSKDFHLDGISYSGIPIFVRAATMRIEFLPTEFCIYVAVLKGRTSAPKTWQAYGFTLLRFIRFMEINNFAWKRSGERTEEHIAHFRRTLAKERLVVGTIARHIRIVCAFYQWMFAKGYIDKNPLELETAQTLDRGPLAHLRAKRTLTRSILIPPVPKRRRYPRYFTADERQRIFDALTQRDQLVMKWALYTGAREFEIAGLRVSQMPQQASYRSRKAYALRIIGKGSVSADLCVPTWLLNETYQYIHHFERRSFAKRAISRGTSVPDNVFLSRWATSLRPNTIYHNFKAALNQAHIEGTFHDLRHTFAISMLDALMKLARHSNTDGVNALLELKYLMRHASLTSTQIYLEARNYYLTTLYSDLFETPDSYYNEL